MPLFGHVLALFAMIGLTEGRTIERISKPLHRAVLKILRSAESAVRRLIVAAARDIVVEDKPRRPAAGEAKDSQQRQSKADGEAKAKRKRGFLFKLFDPLKRHGRRFKKKRRGPEPHVYSLESFLQQRPAPAAPAPVEQDAVDDGIVNAAPLVRRLVAVLDAVAGHPAPRDAARTLAGPSRGRAPS